VFLINVFTWGAFPAACEPSEVWSVKPRPEGGAIQIHLRGKSFTTFVFRDPAIPRPYFANFFSPSGVKITRNHPPAADDPQDHDKMHPGMWLAFGDLSGADSWRLAAPVEHVRFTVDPHAADQTLMFAVENRYLSANSRREICRETCNYVLHQLSYGVLILWDSDFHAEHGEFTFGDQEELGLGVRLTKPVAVNSRLGGRILNSNGQQNEKDAWGQQADWCDYSGVSNGQFVGIMLMPHPGNIRRSWCHARDTGFMAMNPFGRHAFTGGESSSTVVPVGESFRLRYGALLHWNHRPSEFDPDRAYQAYLRLVNNRP
jgi:hypothetical protein